MNVPLWGKPTFAEQLDAETKRVATEAGCDRGTFTVCWGEHEKGLICKCKEEARRALISRTPDTGGKPS